MFSFIIVAIIAYLLYGLSFAMVNKSKMEDFRIMTILDWPWLIYTKEGTKAWQTFIQLS